MVIELPGGGGERRGLGGRSVGDGPGVPVLAVGEGNGVLVPIPLGTGETGWDADSVGVVGPGYERGVSVKFGPGNCDPTVGLPSGPGYCDAMVGLPSGPGYCGTD